VGVVEWRGERAHDVNESRRVFAGFAIVLEAFHESRDVKEPEAPDGVHASKVHVQQLAHAMDRRQGARQQPRRHRGINQGARCRGACIVAPRVTIEARQTLSVASTAENLAGALGLGALALDTGPGGAAPRETGLGDAVIDAIAG